MSTFDTAPKLPADLVPESSPFTRLMRAGDEDRKALLNTLPPDLRTLPGPPFPHGYRERKRDSLRRIDGWSACHGDIQRFFHAEAKDKLAALAGGAVAVFVANAWVDLLLDLQGQKEREKLRGCGWDAPLSIWGRERAQWRELTTRLSAAANDNDEVMAQYGAAMKLMTIVGKGDFDGRAYHFDDVVSAARRGVHNAAKNRGFIQGE